jgi:hypothetical protein
VFLADGTALASFGEWARVDDHLVFSMPTAPDASPGDLHLVSVPVRRLDLARTERYAETVRATTYAATRGEADFAQLSGHVANILNQVALLADPDQRLATAERARRSLTDWSREHYGYRANEVREILGVLDEVISGLRASAGRGGFDLAFSTSTFEPPSEPLLTPPDQAEVVRQLLVASTVVDSATEKMSLLQSVVALVDRAVDLLPASFARTIRASALGAIAEEQRVGTQYARLRVTALADISKHAGSADVRSLERLRDRLREQDTRLGRRRPEDVAALIATVDAHLDSARRLRLAHDQWLFRIDGLRRYQRATRSFVETLVNAGPGLADIRDLAGPLPGELRDLAQRLSRASRRLAIVDVPPAIASMHAVLQSAYSLAESAVQLRMDAAAHADVDLARQAAAAASGSMMLLVRARTDLDAAMQSPLTARAPAQP